MLTTITNPQIEEKLNAFRQCIMDFGIDPEQFEQLIKKKKYKNFFDFFHEWATIVAPWDPDTVERMNYSDFSQFHKIFFFKKVYLEEQKKELKIYLTCFPEFRDNIPKAIFEKMRLHLNQINAMNNDMYQYINQIPKYGGPMQAKHIFPLPPILPQEPGGEQLQFSQDYNAMEMEAPI